MVNVTVCVSDLAGIYCAYRRMLPSLCSSEPEDWRECTRAYVPSRECYCTAYECQFKNSIVTPSLLHFEAIWGSEGINPLLNLSTGCKWVARLTSRPLYLRKVNSIPLGIRCWVDLRGSFAVLEKRKISCSCCKSKYDSSNVQSAACQFDWDYVVRVLVFCSSLLLSTYTSSALLYRVIRNDCRGFNNLSYTIHLR